MNIPLKSDFSDHPEIPNRKFSAEEISELVHKAAEQKPSIKIAEFPAEETSKDKETKRPAWRARLVDAERGFKIGLRTDSTLIVHLSIGVVILSTAVVLGISLIEWTILILSLTTVLAAEISQHILKTVWERLGHHFEKSSEKTLRLSTGCCFCCHRWCYAKHCTTIWSASLENVPEIKN